MIALGGVLLGIGVGMATLAIRHDRALAGLAALALGGGVAFLGHGVGAW